VLAFGGGVCPHPFNFTYPPDFTPATPSLFRIDEGAADIKLAGLWDHGYGAVAPYWPPDGGGCHWGKHYPYPGTSVPLYPFWTFPNVTMWNCWFGSRTATAYWNLITTGGAGITPMDKPVYFLQ
jgi:hypothetical protein